MPEFDRLYLDMNGIIHCASHNNSEEELEKQEKQQQEEDDNGKNGGGGVASPPKYGIPPITDEQIFQNVCYYVDRVVGDIVQPKQLVFLAIDGVAPRAKLNQQRSRRYRSGTEQEIEMHLMTLQRVQEGKEDDLSKEYLIEADGGAFDGYRPHRDRGAQRFSGTIDDVSSTASISAGGPGVSTAEDGVPGFHSNEITPGTPFLHKCSQHILKFIRHKLQTDPKWHDLTIVFSGHDVPGEGEHKILEFIRHEKHKPNYDPNTSHCIFGQDGDLIMLGLAMHEPHMCLLREEVVFDPARRKAIETLAKLENEKLLLGERENGDDSGNDSSGNNQPPLSAAVQSYIHNANFELLHISVLREYLGLEFETSEFYPKSRYDLEATIDDFVFMTFFVGNDFLPHMPALDIGDEAFDLLFYAYKKNRGKWLKDGLYRRTITVGPDGKKGKPKFKTVNHPYLTDAGTITSGTRLEGFLVDVGSYEDPYYHNKRETKEEENDRMRRADEKAGRESLIPSQEILDRVEMAGRSAYVDMLLKNSQTEDDKTGVLEEGEGQVNEDSFKPVTSSTVPDAELVKKLGGVLRGSLSPDEGGVAKVDSKKDDNVDGQSLVDLKGRYYYDKFGYSPFDAEKHISLRKAYITGLVWNLEYYYKGVVSWEWFYPYSYGPMLSDLVNINSILSEIPFSATANTNKRDGKRQVDGEPLRPFEQLLGCLPPSSSYLLPEPYRWFMTSPDSPLIDFYPDSFTVDMNGKRWPWEAVTLLPFIDSKKLIEASRTLIDESLLTEEEKRLNQFGETHVLARSLEHDDAVKAEPLNDSVWAKVVNDANVAFQPQLLDGTKTPGASFPTLKDAPVTRLNRRKAFLNVFGLRSRYRTAMLEMEDELPAFPPTPLLAQHFIGTTVNFRYPILYEGFVCSVADSTTLYRGNEKPQTYSEEAQMKRPALLAKMFKELQIGEGRTGTGGFVLPKADITLTVRPLEAIKTLPDGTKAKVYAKNEIEIPFVAALFSPSCRDPRLDVPAKLEENPFIFGGQSQLDKYVIHEQGKASAIDNKLDILSEKHAKNSTGAKKMSAAGYSRGFATFLAKKDGARDYRFPNNRRPPHRSFHSAANIARRGGPRQRVIGAAGVMAVSAFFFTACMLQVDAAHIGGVAKSIFSRHGLGGQMTTEKATPHLSTSTLMLRGGDLEQGGDMFPNFTPPLEFAHGTTTISFVFQGGIVAAVDSRASIGNFVGSKTTQKVLPVSKNILGTMAGGAADCSFWIRLLRSEAKMHELLHEGRGISVARASCIISNAMYQNRGLDLSVGTMIMGYHHREGFNIYYVDNTGVRIQGDMFAVGSGSTFALGILDTEERRFDMTEEEAVSLGIKAIRHATLRDAMSGGYIGVYLITKDGWRKVFSGDLASIR
ncbi:hypothetical protein ACHAXR_012940 [Thalassiosira sp. AJA248-18]